MTSKGDQIYMACEDKLKYISYKNNRVRFESIEEMVSESEQTIIECKDYQANISNEDDLKDFDYKNNRKGFELIENILNEDNQTNIYCKGDQTNKASVDELEDFANNNTLVRIEEIHQKEIGNVKVITTAEDELHAIGVPGMLEVSGGVSVLLCGREKSQDSGFSDSECGTVILPRRPASLGSSSRPSTPSSLVDEEDPHQETFSLIPPPQHSSTPKSKSSTEYNSQDATRIGQWTCPVNMWLCEARYWCDPECMSTLQNKPIIAGSNERVMSTTAVAVNAIRNIHHQLRVICERLTILYRRLKNNNLNISWPFFEKLVRKMEKLLLDHNINISEEFDCSGLLLAFNTLHSTEDEIPNLVAILKSVALLFAKNVERLLLTYIKMLIDLLEHEKAPSSLSIVLSGISSLELEAPHLSELLSLSSGISSILLVIVDSNSQAVRTAGLNILATTCCTPSSIRQLEKSGGLEVLCEILSSEKRGEAEQCGAISLFAQVTGPWLDVTIQGVKDHLDSLIPAITRLIVNNPSTEMLMMCALSLANISSLEVKNVVRLVSWNSVTILLKAVRVLGTKASVFIKEQTATLLANMSAINGVLQYLRRNRAVPALLCFLQATPSPLHNQRETYATFRLQHKSIIALSRLCSDSDAAKQVVELQGISRIVRLCKDENERNYNDGVLVACLVALRKIADHCGNSVMQSLDASELVEPNLLESFLLYSSNQPK